MGQSKKLRFCPALSREISAAECGENRHVRYACPEACPFNPFAPANYTELLVLENGHDSTLLRRLAAEDRGAGPRILAAQKSNAGHGLHAATAWHLFFKRDTQGSTLAERWVQAGLPGLKNDERILFRGKMQLRVALLETRRILDAARFEAVDLLEPEGQPRLFVDRSMGARAVRFSTVLTWAYPLPHFWRVSGSGIGMDEVGPFPALESIEACIAHFGGPAERGEQRRWLAENFVRIDDALAATGLERRRQMFAGMDASFVAVTYALRVPFDTARARLAGASGLEEESVTKEEAAQGFVQAMVWLDDRQTHGQEFADAGGGRVVLGRVVLGRKEWRVEGIGSARMGRLRAAFEARMGSQVAFARERRDDLGGRIGANDPAPDLALVPPRLLEHPMIIDLSSSRVAPPPPGVSMQDHMAAMENNYRRTWADLSVPALGGLSPRTAVGDPVRRPQVIALVKGHVRQVDQRNLESGRADDINFLIRELGLTEIDVPPPPPRARVPTEAARSRSEDDSADGAAEEVKFVPKPGQSAALRAPAPRLEGPPLTLAEAVRRIGNVQRTFEKAVNALEELNASGATLVDDLSELTRGMLNDTEFSFLLVFAYQAWFALVPPGVRAPTLEFRAMEADFKAVRDRADPRRGANLALTELRNACRQPGLLDAVIAGVIEGTKRSPKHLVPAPAAVALMLVALKAMLDELDRALRRP